MSYGIDLVDACRSVVAARILKGEEPGSLPVSQTTKFEFVFNIRTAKVRGLVFPPSLTSLVFPPSLISIASIADEVID